MLEYLRQKLIDAGIGVSVYISFAPPNPDEIVMIRSVFSGRPDVGHPYDSPRVQVFCRAKAERAAYTAAHIAYQTLHEAPNMLGSMIVDIQAMQSPYFAGQDEQSRYIYTLVLQCEVVREFV